jgi:predicted permease
LLTRALVALQVAISLAVLIGAGLLLRTVQNLRNAPSGFDTRNLIIFRVNPARGGYGPKQAGRLYDNLHASLSAIPGIRAVSHSFPELLANQPIVTNMHIEAKTPGTAAAGTNHLVWALHGSPEFISAMGFRLIRGRGLNSLDTQPDAPAVCLINETAAKTFFPGEDPIGRRWGREPQLPGDIEILGIFGDVKFKGPRDPAPPTVLEPFPHEAFGAASFEIRTAGDPAKYMKAVRETVQSVAPDLPIVRMLTQGDDVEQSIQQERFFALAYSLFGALALLLASIGLFGVMSYSVASRTNEIGIRMSLGARQHEVVRMVLFESLWMIAGGVAIGLGAAGLAGRLIQSMLFGLAPTDPVTIVIAVLTLSVVAVFAGYLPARRAARIDPLVALRYE